MGKAGGYYKPLYDWISYSI